MARLDRLAAVKELAQMAACIGREFSHELLGAVSFLSDSALRDALAQLLDAELVFRRGAPRLVAHRLSGLTAMHFGAFAEARPEFETILRLYEPSQHRPPAIHYIHDPKISALPYMAVILWILGYPQQARRWSVEALQYAKVLNQATLTAHVRVYGGAGLDELLRDTTAVREHADAIIGLADQHNLHYFRLSGLILRGWVMAQEGEFNRGVTLMRQSASERLALGVGWFRFDTCACWRQPTCNSALRKTACASSPRRNTSSRETMSTCGRRNLSELRASSAAYRALRRSTSRLVSNRRCRWRAAKAPSHSSCAPP